MKTTHIIATLCAVSLFITGCASVEVSNKFNGMSVDGSQRIAHLNGTVWGLYIFHIPVIYPYNVGEVKLDTCLDMVTKRARELGATRVVDLQSRTTSVWIPFTFVGFYREVQISATAAQ